MKRLITALALAAMMVMGTASVALAEKPAGPTCFGAETDPALPTIANHGEHITRYYVAVQGNAGGGRSAHFGPHAVSAGASFCLVQAPAPELLGQPGRFAD